MSTIEELEQEVSKLLSCIRTDDKNWLEAQAVKIWHLVSSVRSDISREQRMKEAGIAYKPGGGFVYTGKK